MRDTSNDETPPNTPSRSPNDLDRVSLVRALEDFEIANARVLDLTQRLLESERARALAESRVQHVNTRLGRVLTELLVAQEPSAAAYRMWRRARKVALERVKRVRKP